MTQPRFAPITNEDEVRPSYRLAPPRRWVADRPADFRPGPPPDGSGNGIPGPDQGYALLLAGRLVDRLVLGAGEVREDVVSGAMAIALRRAALFGRAPVLADLEFAVVLFGYLAAAPADLLAARRELFDGLAHDYWRLRLLAHAVPEALLRRAPAAVAPDSGAWREVKAEEVVTP